MCRITIDGTIAQFSCKLDIDPELWDTAAGRTSGRSDIALRDIRPAFITDFEFFMKMDKGLDVNTVWLYMMPLRKMIAIATNHGWLYRDPFWEYAISFEERDRGFLPKEEIKALLIA